VLYGREVIEPLLDQEANDAVRVKDEVATLGFAITDDTVTSSDMEITTFLG
jgi:hypothetical protein